MTITLSCPFCGAAPALSSILAPHGMRISSAICTGTGCEAAVNVIGDEDKAAAVWNRRQYSGVRRAAVVLRLKPGAYLRHWKELTGASTRNRFNITEDLSDATVFPSTHQINQMMNEIRAIFQDYAPEFVSVEVTTHVKARS